MDEYTITGGLEALQERFDPDALPFGAEPVFLLSAGWRSGSTLVQRLIVSGGDVLMWGEPYDHCGLIRSLADTLRPFQQPWPPGEPAGAWPPAAYLVDPRDPPSAGRWIANAYPHPIDLLAAHRAFFDRLFDQPARAAGFARWGVKAVRLGGEHAVYLRALYPDARFVFLHRNPWDAWLSYRRRHEERQGAYWWFFRWPDQQVGSVGDFASVWRRLVESFLEWAPHVNAEIVPYEAVVAGEAFEVLDRAAGVEVDRPVLRKRLGGARGDHRRARRPLDESERAEITRIVGAVARRVGYAGPSGGA